MRDPIVQYLSLNGKALKDWTIGVSGANERMDRWLAAQKEIGSRGRARDAIERGKVFLNGVAVSFSEAGRKLAVGDRVGYWEDRPGSARPRDREVVAARGSLAVIHEDAALIVANKPAGWLVEPLPGEEAGEVTLRDMLADHLRSRVRVRPHVVHRIDRDTSGLVLFALTVAARDALKAQFERRTPERLYLAIVHGHVVPAAGTWRDKLVWDRDRLIQKRAHVHEERAKDAIARYRVLEQHRRAALLEVSLVTGKRNQIRVQAGSRGYPLVGERLYAFGHTPQPGDPTMGRQALHAASLSFRHPVTGRQVTFAAPTPQDMRQLLAAIRRD